MPVTYIVKLGDTLYSIAKSAGTTYQKLAEINGIPNPDRIVVGQEIKLTGSSSSNSTSPSNRVTVTAFGLLSNSTNKLYATWIWGKQSETESYKVEWAYKAGGVVFIGSSETISVDKYNYAASRQSMFDIPSNATYVTFSVLPIAKKKTVDGKETTPYWTATWSTQKKHVVKTPPTKPDVPQVKIEGFKLTATLQNIADDTDGIEFEILKNNSKVYTTICVLVKKNYASCSYTVEAGGQYCVRCKAVKLTSTTTSSSSGAGAAGLLASTLLNGGGSTWLGKTLDTESEWSNYSDNYSTRPTTPKEIISLKALSSTSVSIDWTNVSTAKKYRVEYTTQTRYFDSAPSEIKYVEVESVVGHAEITNLELGQEYFFRVRAINDNGDSGWTPVKSIIIGKAPSAPTTWSSVTTGLTGETVTLYWVHNSEDNSTLTHANLELVGNGINGRYVFDAPGAYGINASGAPYTIETYTDDEAGKTSSCVIDTSRSVEGTTIRWRVRTSGITKEYGDWSVQRTVDIYAPPTLQFNITDANENEIRTVESFPFYAYGLAGPSSQIPIGYHLSVIANEAYSTVDSVGNTKMVNVGEAVYSKYFDINDALLVEFSAGNIDMENNISYTATCTVSMNSGLTAEASAPFTVAWTDVSYSPNVEIGVDEETLVAHLRPYCEEWHDVYYKVLKHGDVYTTATEITGQFAPDEISSAYTVSGERVFRGRASTGDAFYCEYVEDEKDTYNALFYFRVDLNNDVFTKTATKTPRSKVQPIYTQDGSEVLVGVTTGGAVTYYCIQPWRVINDVLLSVYRREFDGSFTEIASGLENSDSIYVVDPHPALDYARYRIVATTKDTGAVSYYDAPGHPVNYKAAVIQWDEDWSSFSAVTDDPLAEPKWAGSILRLPYNIDVSDNSQPDVALVEYIGRSRPVSYYGTQNRKTATWNMVIEKSDTESLYMLRRLSEWMGNVYVREPSGSGYWANVTVSYSQKHLGLTIPVTLNITRVEGGI